MHDPDALRFEGQLFVCWKSPAFAPVMLMLEIEKLADPEFEIVNPCGALCVPTVTPLKFRLFVLSDNAGEPAEPLPVPLSGAFTVVSA